VEADGPRNFLLKTGLKSEFGSVEPEQGVAKSNWAYAVSSDTRYRRLVKTSSQRPQARTRKTQGRAALLVLA
jgi:hypothetical protein